MWENDKVILYHSVILCFLSLMNIITWPYLVYEFIDELKRKKYRSGFYPIVTLMVIGYCILNIGVFVIRGVSFLHYTGYLPKLSHNGISILSHILQEVMSFVMLIVSVVMIIMIRSKRAEHRKMK